MRITKVIIGEEVRAKILYKHNVEAVEVEEVLLQAKVMLKSAFGRYLAIGYYQRYLTVVFEYNQGLATIITAYPSSERQINYYKRKKP